MGSYTGRPEDAIISNRGAGC